MGKGDDPNCSIATAMSVDFEEQAQKVAADVPGTQLVTLGGSHAYGTNHDDSDLDLRGLYVEPLEKVLGLSGAQQTITRSDPDVAMYEVAHFFKLASSANPTVLEVLWSRPLVQEEIGRTIIDSRGLFVSKRALKTYGGYALSQLKHAREGTGGSRGTKHLKREKFLLHTLRILDAGCELMRTGEIRVRVENPERLRERARRPLEEIQKEAESSLARMQQLADASSLPEHPDFDKINRLLFELRMLDHKTR